MEGDTKPWGYKWRSSPRLVVSSIMVALFAEVFLYGFLAPILSFMLEERLHLDPSQTQSYTTALLTSHGLIGLVAAPFIAHLAEKASTQKGPLLIALAGCFVGTLMVALASSVWVLFLGRSLQALTGSATWVVGFALLANNVDKKSLGKSMGTAMSFVAAGAVAGPAMSGTLLQLFGYWAAWSLPLVVLVMDIIARLLMIEPGLGSGNTDSQSKINDAVPEESTALLSDSPVIKAGGGQVENKDDLKHEYYKTMLTDPRVLTSLLNTVTVSALVSGITNTLPVHLRQAFEWKSLLISMMFFCLQVPNIVLSSPAGWLRDHIGLRTPTVLGWAAMVPPLLLMGFPGDSHFPWAGSDAAGQPIFITSLIALGGIMPLVRGVGAVQLAYVVKDMEIKDPVVFEATRSNLRVFSMTEVGYGLGSMFGPLLTGSMFEGLGFFWMAVTLAIICLIQAVISWLYLDTLPPSDATEAAV